MLVSDAFNSILMRGFILAGLAIAIASQCTATRADTPKPDVSPRVALIIANGSHVRRDEDPVILNARSLADALRDVGFVVTVAENTTDKKMELAFFDFFEAVPWDAMAIVYFAGRGGIVQGQILPFPINMSPLGLPPSNDLSDLMSALAAKNIRGALWLIDAQFTQHFGKEALRIRVPSKTIIAFASMLHGHTTDVGRFGSFLANGIRSGATGIYELLAQTRREVLKHSAGKQIPWEIYNAPPEIWAGAFRTR